MLIAIWAHARNGVIGKNKKMPWHLPKDLAFFKKQTGNHPIVMGRKTFEGFDYRPLPKRENIILTRQKELLPGVSEYDNVRQTQDIEAIIERGKKEDIYIIGGAEIYRLFWSHLDELRVTEIDANFDGDTVFNPDLSGFYCYREIIGETNEKNPYPFQFKFYQRNKGDD